MVRTRSGTMDFGREVHRDFTISKCIGSGGFGQVFKAQKRNSDELVALKYVYWDPGATTNPFKEIRLLKECNHQNLTKFHGTYLQRHTIIIAMEFCGGGSLFELYKDCDPFYKDETAYVCREVLQGLKYLHAKSIIHRDIKGQNVLVNNVGDVKICDLGLAARLSDHGALFNKAGTSKWMAPEVVRGKNKMPYNEKCDIWSLGITAIEVAQAEHPPDFMNPRRIASFISRLKEERNWSRKFEDFICQVLNVDPRKRPSAEELLLHPFVNGAHLKPGLMIPRLKFYKESMMRNRNQQSGLEEEAEEVEESEETEESEDSEDSDDSEESDDSEDSQDSEDSEESEDSEDSDDSEESDDSEDSQDSEDSDDSEESDDSEDSQDSEDSEESEDSEDSDDSEESDDSEDSQDSEDSDDSEESDDSEDSQDSEESEDSEDSDDSEESDDSEDSQDSEESEDSDDSEDSEDSEVSEDSEESEPEEPAFCQPPHKKLRRT
ncbi:serine/threonine-protein kinase dst1-like [Denticeps clupeoides]|uniref:serine/threonine-protein kinase dst1-like n=1 Tax=Denticeps clupeoides TaxID=299321 RepID=UPI0010A4AD10|nr:serine/threonine-protein kinase dst1-like [Denticeps clupeoides]